VTEPTPPELGSLSHDRELAELAALADGTLPVERRAEVEARVAASPRLNALLERQRRALAAIAMLADEPVSATLTAVVDAAVAGARRGTRVAWRPRWWQGRRLAARLSAVGACAAVVAVALVLTLSSGPADPSVAGAARLALEPAVGPAPVALGTNQAQLVADVQGLAFPDYARSFGWQASGVRHGRVGDRSATIVYYSKAGRQVAYAIVAGAALPRPSNAASSVIAGVRYQTMSFEGRPAVTWRRLGHTCVLIGGAPPAQLLSLASWRVGGTPSY
jgi:anti-sigma factor RsiW